MRPSYLVLILVLGLYVISGCAAISTKQRSDLAKTTILVYTNNNVGGTGTVVAVKDKVIYVVTADHVAKQASDDPKALWAYFGWGAGSRVQAIEMRSLEGLDVALIKFPLPEGAKLNVLALCERSLVGYEPVIAVGHTGLFMYPTITEGYVTLLHVKAKDSLILHSAQIGPGSSGGPLITEQDFCIAGINVSVDVSGMSLPVNHMVFAVPVWLFKNEIIW